MPDFVLLLRGSAEDAAACSGEVLQPARGKNETPSLDGNGTMLSLGSTAAGVGLPPAEPAAPAMPDMKQEPPPEPKPEEVHAAGSGAAPAAPAAAAATATAASGGGPAAMQLDETAPAAQQQEQQQEQQQPVWDGMELNEAADGSDYMGVSHMPPSSVGAAPAWQAALSLRLDAAGRPAVEAGRVKQAFHAATELGELGVACWGSMVRGEAPPVCMRISHSEAALLFARRGENLQPPCPCPQRQRWPATWPSCGRSSAAGQSPLAPLARRFSATAACSTTPPRCACWVPGRWRYAWQPGCVCGTAARGTAGLWPQVQPARNPTCCFVV